MKPKCGVVIFMGMAFVLLTVFIWDKDSGFILDAVDKTLRSAANNRRWALTSFHRLISSYRLCLSKNLNQFAVHNLLPRSIDSCLGKAIWRLWDVRMLKNKDETKLAILPSIDARDECVQVTLGVGNDIVAEQQLHQLMPTCKHFGADPIFQSGIVYKEIGEYFQLAVSGESDVERGQVLVDGVYHSRNITTIAFSDFISDYANVSKIDYLWIDNEGAEYKIFPKYFITNTLNITICQINVEMHMPLEKIDVDQHFFDRLIKDIVEKSSFLPVYTVLEAGQVRSFYVNVVDSYCVEKFLIGNLFVF